MSQRFFSADPLTGDRGVLAGTEAHHLLHVMRAAVGDRVELFDGRGAQYDAEIMTAHRSSVEFRVLERRDIDRELPFQLTMGVALPKGDRQKWLVEKLTELGVRRLIPLIAEHGVAQPNGNTLARLRRSVIEACKQCGRNRLMQIEAAVTWPGFVERIAKPLTKDHSILVAHPGGAPAVDVLSGVPMDRVIAIGPEGGFAAAEVELALAAGAKSVSLGPRVLRVETAAVAVASALSLRA